ncbi:hypothetical protein ACFWUZ_32660 [Streptomyces sp. NPDC058646]|uniref:hypothetical protein n=1 Tax=Streptomyces sp. NPDC058646 TaxID=3346574 RepID=UPI00364620B3
MDREAAWSFGPAGEAPVGQGDVVALTRRAADRRQGGQVVTVPLVCKWCDADEFQAVAGECYCWGCLMPVGIWDGDVHPDESPLKPMAYPWRLAPSDVQSSPFTPGSSGEAGDGWACPEGHRVFQSVVAFDLAGDGSARRISVGLRCPEDGALLLYIDDAHLVPAGP